VAVIIEKTLKIIAAGANPMIVKKRYEKAVDDVVKY
jgi:chaperonin GroEL (HSP60 family)